MKKLFIALSLVLVAGVAQASVVGIDFASMAAPVANWNLPTNSDLDLEDMVDLDGGATTVGLAWVQKFEGSVDGGATTVPTGAAAAVFPADVGQDYRRAYSADRDAPEFNLAGLAANTPYELQFYAENTSLDYWNEFIATGATTVNSAIVDVKGDTSTLATINVDSDALGVINVTMVSYTQDPGPVPGAVHYRYILNSMTIEQIPEPGTLSLLGLAGVALVVRSRKKR